MRTRPSAGPKTLTSLVLMSAALAPCASRAQEAAPPSPSSPPSASAGDASGLGPICTDRPTKSNGTCTVDPGHWQYETDLFNGSFARVGGVTTDTYFATNPTLKYGVSKTLDLEVNIAPAEVVRIHDSTGKTQVSSGVGDLFVRVKDAVFATADSTLTISAIPYVKLPTARTGIGDGAVEGGVIVPISYKLTKDITLTTEPEADALKDAVGDGRHFNTAQLINLGYALPDNVAVAAEFWANWDFDPLGTIRQSSADLAVSWGAANSLSFDGGLNFGLTRETPGLQAYVGVSQRF